MNQQLQDAYDAIARNDTAIAQSILAKLIVSEKDPSVLEQAWLYMSYAVDERDRKMECLERVLLLNPSSNVAKEMLSQLTLDSTVGRIGNTTDENLSPGQLLSKYGITKTVTERLFIYSPAFKELIQGIIKVVADYHSSVLSGGTGHARMRPASSDEVKSMLARFMKDFSPLISGLISPIQDALNQGDGLTDSHVLNLIEAFHSNFGKYTGTLDEFRRTEFKFQHVNLGKEQQQELKRLTIEMITEPIRQYALFLQEFDKELEELHGKLVDPDFVPTFTFKPDISQVEARVESFIAKYI